MRKNDRISRNNLRADSGSLVPVWLFGPVHTLALLATPPRHCPLPHARQGNTRGRIGLVTRLHWMYSRTCSPMEYCCCPMIWRMVRHGPWWFASMVSKVDRTIRSLAIMRPIMTLPRIWPNVGSSFLLPKIPISAKMSLEPCSAS